MSIELWRKVWREGIAPQMSQAELSLLAKALAEDDHRLMQGLSCIPPSVPGLRNSPARQCCVLSFGAIGGPVGIAEDRFAALCDGSDERMGERAACRYFLNWYDDTPRDEMRRLLLDEVQAALLDKESARA